MFYEKNILYFDQEKNPTEIIYSECLGKEFDITCITNQELVLSLAKSGQYHVAVINVQTPEETLRKKSIGKNISLINRIEESIPVVGLIPDDNFDLNRAFEAEQIPFFTKGISDFSKYVQTVRELAHKD